MSASIGSLRNINKKAFRTKVFTLLLLMVFLVPASVLANATPLNETFESYPPGALTIGSGNPWSAEGTTPVVTIAGSGPTANYAAVANPGTGSSYLGYKYPALATGGVTVSFDINVPNPAKGCGIQMYDSSSKLASGNIAVRFGFGANGQFQFYHNTGGSVTNSGILYDAAHWYHITISVDSTNEAYTLNIIDSTANAVIYDSATGGGGAPAHDGLSANDARIVGARL